MGFNGILWDSCEILWDSLGFFWDYLRFFEILWNHLRLIAGFFRDSLGFFGIPRNSLGFLWLSLGFFGILGDSLKWFEILWDSSRDSFMIHWDSLGYFWDVLQEHDTENSRKSTRWNTFVKHRWAYKQIGIWKRLQSDPPLIPPTTTHKENKSHTKKMAKWIHFTQIWKKNFVEEITNFNIRP